MVNDNAQLVTDKQVSANWRVRTISCSAAGNHQCMDYSSFNARVVVVIFGIVHQIWLLNPGNRKVFAETTQRSV